MFRVVDYPAEPDDSDTRASVDHEPKPMPLEEVVSPQSTTGASQLPPDLQSLMDGLKKQGMVGPSAAPLPIPPPVLAAVQPTSLPTPTRGINSLYFVLYIIKNINFAACEQTVLAQILTDRDLSE
jgi:hypothetical protein